MALPLPAGDRGALRADVLGFPVSMHPGFLLLGGLLAFSAGLGIVRTIVWVAVVAVSVLVHELGHAFVMRSAGASPTITLYAFGGVTRGVLPATASRGRRLAISLAGPAAGLALGAVVFAVAVMVPVDPGGVAEYALGAALFANIGWGVLNLLPMLPLDGGHVLLTLLPGDEDRRLRVASYVSVAVGVAATLLALSIGLVFGALLAAYFTVGNVMAVRGPRADPMEAELVELNRRLVAGDLSGAADAARRLSLREPGMGPVASQLTAADLLDRDEPRDARDELLALPPGSVDRLLEATVLLATGNDALGHEKLRAALAEEPTWWVVGPLVKVLVRRGADPVEALAGVTDPGLRERARRAAEEVGARDAALRFAAAGEGR